MDYPVYILIGLSLLIRFICLGSSDLLAEEAYYWNYAQHLDFGYVDHPPMIAMLIRASTSLLGNHEYGVRITSMLCWLLTVFFSFKLTNLITRGAGQYAVFLLAILPFFFVQSLVITPDQPLLVCWSAALYCLYRALVMRESRAWLLAGIWLGLGLLSKYTIVVLGPATLLYVCIVPSARQWLSRFEPYFSVLIAGLLFTPVIYWNATHEWASFVFQGSRRMHEPFSFSFHEFLGLFLFFLTPLGVTGFVRLFRKREVITEGISDEKKRFLQVFCIVPLIVFAVFSLTHPIKFNWIGPGLLAMIPWLARLIHRAPKSKDCVVLRKGWLLTGTLLLVCYSGMMVSVIFGVPETAHQILLTKFIAWEDFTRHVYGVARQVELETQSKPIIIPLDRYYISSELAFYQAKLLAKGESLETYSVRGSHVFGGESLMYRYWSNSSDLAGQTLLLISDNPHHFDNPRIKKQVIEDSPVQSFWSVSQGRKKPIRRYYYQVVQMRPVSTHHA